MTNLEQVAHALEGSRRTDRCGPGHRNCHPTHRRYSPVGISLTNIETYNKALLPQVISLVEGLRQACQHRVQTIDDTPADLERCRELLSRIEVLLESGDITAGTLARRRSASCIRPSAAPARAMLSAIETFDFRRRSPGTGAPGRIWQRALRLTYLQRLREQCNRCNCAWASACCPGGMASMTMRTSSAIEPAWSFCMIS